MKLSTFKTKNDFESRKKDHIKLALDDRTQHLNKNQFNSIGLIHNAMPEMNFSDVNLTTQLLGNSFSSPLFISSMTAGHQQGENLNHLFAELAQTKNILFCLGSQKKQIYDVSADKEVKKIKQKFKKLKIVSNIGIEEVILLDPNKIIRLVEATDSIALIIHLNPLLEVFQKPTEEVYFKNGLKSLERLIKAIHVPVVVKEVGFGLSAELSKKLFQIGVSVVDVAGSGGTHWAKIEALRNPNQLSNLGVEAFSDWGFSTVSCLKSHQDLIKKKSVWASGGIRSGVDAAKCLAMGAEAVGLAQPILKLALDKKMKLQTIDKVISGYEQIEFELKVAHFCSGIKSPREFNKKKVWYERF